MENHPKSIDISIRIRTFALKIGISFQERINIETDSFRKCDYNPFLSD